MRCNKHRGRRQPEMGSTGLPKHVLNELETFSFQRTFIQSPKSSCDLVEFSEIIRLQRSTFNFQLPPLLSTYPLLTVEPSQTTSHGVYFYFIYIYMYFTNHHLQSHGPPQPQCTTVHKNDDDAHHLHHHSAQPLQTMTTGARPSPQERRRRPRRPTTHSPHPQAPHLP